MHAWSSNEELGRAGLPAAHTVFLLHYSELHVSHIKFTLLDTASSGSFRSAFVGKLMGKIHLRKYGLSCSVSPEPGLVRTIHPPLLPLQISSTSAGTSAGLGDVTGGGLRPHP